MVDGNTALARTEPNYALIEQVVIRGDLKGLTATQKSAYYGKVCESIGLNPLTRPFEYIVLNGREVLYARKDCACTGSRSPSRAASASMTSTS
jgi:hypothetical protein